MFCSGNARKRTAFTLIELLVVIAIISLLVSILLPSLSRAKELAKRALCSSNQHHIGLGLLMYASENDEFLPEAYRNPDVVDWYHDAIEGVATQMGSFNENHPKYPAKWGGDLTPRYGAIFVCPSSTQDPSPLYGRPDWLAGAEIVQTGYFLITHSTSYDTSPDYWNVEPVQKVSQEDSVDPTKPCATFMLADKLSWRFDYLIHYTASEYWYGNHIAQYVVPNTSEDPDDVDAGSNCLYLDGHVEWHDSGELNIFARSSGEEHWY